LSVTLASHIHLIILISPCHYTVSRNVAALWSQMCHPA